MVSLWIPVFQKKSYFAFHSIFVKWQKFQERKKKSFLKSNCHFCCINTDKGLCFLLYLFSNSVLQLTAAIVFSSFF